MAKMAVIKTGGKQYLVKENDELVVEKLDGAEKEMLQLEAVAVFDETGKALRLGTPSLSTKIQAQVIEQGKGEKIRVARFKSKVRYRRVKGFRPQLTRIKILTI